MVESKDMFNLEGASKHESSGLRHLRPPPKIRGKTNYGVKPSLTFYFDTEEQKQEVYNFFKEGDSRIPSGNKLFQATKQLKEEDTERLKKTFQNMTV